MTRIGRAFRFIILLGVCLLGGISSAAGVDFSYQSGLLWGDMKGGAIEGRHLFCAMNHGLMILDIADPSSPALVSTVPFMDGLITAVAASGNQVYLGVGSGALEIVDISSVTSPYVIGSFPVSNWVGGISVSGTTVYVCDEFSGVRLIDVSDPTHPVQVGFFSTSATHGDEVCFAQGDYAYVASWSDLWILDAADPGNPQQIGYYHAPNHIRGISVSGSTLCLAVDANGLVTVDITDLTAPVELAQLPISTGSVRAVVTDGNAAFLGIGTPDDGYGVKVVDISDPSQPAVSGQILTPANMLDLSSGRLFVTNEYTQYGLYDVSDPVAPQTLTDDAIPFYGYSGYGQEIATDGNFIYIAGGYMGLVIVDNTDPARPVVVSQGINPGRSYDLELRDRYIYLVGDGDYATAGLNIIDVLNPREPVIVGSLHLLSSNRIALCGNYALVGNNAPTNYIIDISNPTNPVLLGTTYIPGITRGLAGKDHYWYASYDFGIVITDIADPANPVILDTLTADGAYGELLMYKGYLLAGVSTGFQVLDVTTDPLSPTPIGFCGGRPSDIKPYGDHVFVTNAQGMVIVDMSDLTMPAVIGVQPMASGATTIAPYYNGFAAYDPTGLTIFQVAMPPCCAKAGDATYDLNTNLADVVYLINYIFKSGPPLLCPATGDVNGDCNVNVGDAVDLVNYIFRGGDAPTCSPCP